MAVLTSTALTGITTRMADASMSAGAILQVVQTVKTDVSSLTSSHSTWADISGMSVDITPSSANNKIFIMCTANIGNIGNGHRDVRLLRDSTAICIGDAGGDRGSVSGSSEASSHGNHMANIAFQYLDSPNTTSATTYKIQWKSGLVDIAINRSKDDTDNVHHPRGASTITVMEVAV